MYVFVFVCRPFSFLRCFSLTRYSNFGLLNLFICWCCWCCCLKITINFGCNMKMSRKLSQIPHENSALNWWNEKLYRLHIHTQSPTHEQKQKQNFGLFDFCPDRIFLFLIIGFIPWFKKWFTVLKKKRKTKITTTTTTTIKEQETTQMYVYIFRIVCKMYM